MAKNPRAKCNPPNPRKEPGTKKILTFEHLPGHITITCKLGNLMEKIKRKIQDDN